jgi:hypothetical protein
MVALCCLLIETLQSFSEAAESPAPAGGPCYYPQGPCIRPPPSTTDLFKKFLRLPTFGGEFDDERITSRFIDGIRNGILHEAETRRWVIRRDEPEGRILEPLGRGYVLNRTAFYKALKTEFEKYLQQLRNPENQNPRKRFLKKMDDIVREI